MDEVSAVGKTGQILVDDDYVTISRKGLRAFINQGAKGDKRIPIASITAVQLKPAKLTDGYLQLSILGGVESRKGWADAGTDENTITFGTSKNRDFEAVRNRIERLIAQVASSSTHAPDDSVDQLERLAQLKNQGLLTEQEFQAAKAKILSSM